MGNLHSLKRAIKKDPRHFIVYFGENPYPARVFRLKGGKWGAGKHSGSYERLVFKTLISMGFIELNDYRR